MNKIKKLALGTAQFGLPYGISNKNGQVSQYDASQILIKAKSVGIGVLDTAIAYGDSERILGKCDLNDFKIITKLPDFKEDKKELGTWFERQLSTSFSRLDVKNIDGLLLHRPEQLFTEHGDYLYALLQEAKADGKINRIGLSLYDPSEIPKCFDKFEFDLIQIPGNIFDRRLEKSGWLKELTDYNVDVHLRSIFLQGLLLMSTNNRPKRFEKWNSLFQHWNSWLNETKQTALDACVQYALSLEGIDRVIVGVDSVFQLEKIIQATKTPFLEPPHDLVSSDIDLLNPSRWATK